MSGVRATTLATTYLNEGLEEAVALGPSRDVTRKAIDMLTSGGEDYALLVDWAVRCWGVTMDPKHSRRAQVNEVRERTVLQHGSEEPYIKQPVGDALAVKPGAKVYARVTATGWVKIAATPEEALRG